MARLKRIDELGTPGEPEWVNATCIVCGVKQERMHKSKVCDACDKEAYDARVRKHLGIDK